MASSKQPLAAFVVVARGGSGIAELRINGYIRANEVRLVAPDGSQIGVKKLSEALWLADQLGLDLVEVAPDAKPPVCRLMDYGKFKYEQSVRDREARKKQTRTVIKEFRMKPRIGPHDYDILRRRAETFLGDGDKVRVTVVRIPGRENTRPEMGLRLMERLSSDVAEMATVEQAPQRGWALDDDDTGADSTCRSDGRDACRQRRGASRHRRSAGSQWRAPAVGGERRPSMARVADNGEALADNGEEPTE